MKRSGLPPRKTAMPRGRGLIQRRELKPKPDQQPKPTGKRARRRNDGPWRQAVLAARGAACRSCGDTRDPQADHIWPRGQGGSSVVENGGVLCGPWSRCSPFKGGCHAAHTELKLRWRLTWLDDDQLRWLREVGYVWRAEDGTLRGRGSRRFE